MKRTLLVTFGVAISLILSGCSNNREPSAETTTTSAGPSAPQPLGATRTFTGVGSASALEVDVTVFAVNQNIALRLPTPASGGHWVGADIETCLKKQSLYSRTLTVGWSDWSVSDAQNGQYISSDKPYSGFPTPQYPFSDEPIVEGECVRGWVLFPVAKRTIITKVKYKPSFDDPAFWSAT